MYAEILSGRSTRERKLAVCAGTAHLEPAEKAEALTVLAEDADDEVRERAENALLSVPMDAFVVAFLGDAPVPHIFRYCAKHYMEKTEVAAAMIFNWRCPAQIMTAAAKHLQTSNVQDLMDNLDRLSSSPALVAALMHSASLTADQQQQLEELSRTTTEGLDALALAVADAESDPEKRITLLQRLSKMRVAERVQVALKGNREERMALIRDSCKVVQRAVLQSARLTDREVEGFAAMANLTDDILRLIGSNRKFRKELYDHEKSDVQPQDPRGPDPAHAAQRECDGSQESGDKQKCARDLAHLSQPPGATKKQSPLRRVGLW